MVEELTRQRSQNAFSTLPDARNKNITIKAIQQDKTSKKFCMCVTNFSLQQSVWITYLNHLDLNLTNYCLRQKQYPILNKSKNIIPKRVYTDFVCRSESFAFFNKKHKQNDQMHDVQFGSRRQTGILNRIEQMSASINLILNIVKYNQ
ncbi:Hypothetical_protein [Hexamita inflata]|uniref:Hypothetical_protein n=1 Tax=Hexamita inflata TaxID=28002 RepID=A0AA86PYR4_9EUKA|nr:Hypothetical protein HINF_LOCUS36452 [Hexamita inflata]CAI9948809.1 Hypothetical protein HINF_LOCUS36454 [Hexamita inflata]CAI9967644.1 Hypothetical protein HINF_LOCUS55289 [Hexamita inflata]